MLTVPKIKKFNVKTLRPCYWLANIFAFFKLSLQLIFYRITESYNILCWKGPTRIIESNSWPHIGLPKNQTTYLRRLSKYFLNFHRLRMLLWEAYSSAWPGMPEYNFIGSYCWSLERRDQHLPFCSPLWGSCRLWGSHPPVSSKLNKVTSASPHTTSPPELSSFFVALLWTLSNGSMSLLVCGSQNCTQYSRWDHSSAE